MKWAFRLGLHCLPKYLFNGIGYEIVTLKRLLFFSKSYMLNTKQCNVLQLTGPEIRERN